MTTVDVHNGAIFRVRDTDTQMPPGAPHESPCPLTFLKSIDYDMVQWNAHSANKGGAKHDKWSSNQRIEYSGDSVDPLLRLNIAW